MSNAPVPASAPALPSATVLPFPAAVTPPLHISLDAWKRAYITLDVSDQFSGFDDASLDRAIGDMIEYGAEGVARMVRENRQTLADLRQVVAFLAAIDLRIGASAARVLSQRGC